MKKLLLNILILLIIIVFDNCGLKTSKFFNLYIVLDKPLVNDDAGNYPKEIIDLNYAYIFNKECIIKSTIPLVKIIRIDTSYEKTILSENDLSTSMIFGWVKTSPKQENAVADIVNNFYSNNKIDSKFLISSKTDKAICLNRLNKYLNDNVYIYSKSYPNEKVVLLNKEFSVYNNIEQLKRDIANNICKNYSDKSKIEKNFYVIFEPDFNVEEPIFEISPDSMIFNSKYSSKNILPQITISNNGNGAGIITLENPKSWKKYLSLTQNGKEIDYEENFKIDPNSNINFTINIKTIPDKEYLDILFNTNEKGGITKELYLKFILSNKSPLIEMHPKNKKIKEGDNVSFTVKATGSHPLFYKWYNNNKEIPFKNSPSLSLQNVVKNDRGEYFVIVSNQYGSIRSNKAKLEIYEPDEPDEPMIIDEPNVKEIIHCDIFEGWINKAKFSCYIEQIEECKNYICYYCGKEYYSQKFLKIGGSAETVYSNMKCEKSPNKFHTNEKYPSSQFGHVIDCDIVIPDTMPTVRIPGKEKEK